MRNVSLILLSSAIFLQVSFAQTVAEQQAAMNNKLISITNGLKTTSFTVDSLSKYDFKTSGILPTNMKANGSWTSLFNPTTLYDKITHFDRLQNIATLYRSNTVTIASLKAEMVVTLKKGIHFLDAYCCISCAYAQSGPGYSTYCDYPNRYANILLTLKNDANFPDDTLKKYSQAFLFDSINYVRNSPNTLSDVSNYLDHCTSVLKKGILENNYALFLKGEESPIQSIKISDNTEVSGIRTDYSFHAHGHQMYYGGYGKSFVGGIIPLMLDIQNNVPSQTVVTPKEILIMDSLVLDGFMQFSYRGASDFGVLGRNISRKVSSRQAMYYGTFSTLINVNSNAGLDTNRLVVFRRHNDVYQTTKTPFPEIGNKHFWNGDMMAHHGANYYMSAKIPSARTVGFETQNGENIFGYNTSLGATNIMTTGNEYRIIISGNVYKEIFPMWDWSRIPGTTAELGYVPPISVDRYIGKNKFGGGISNGTSGGMAFVLQDSSYTTFYNGAGVTAPKYNRIKARKAYFFMNDALLCLGTAIHANKTRPVVTSINQCYTNGVITVGETSGNSVVTNKTFANTLKWVHHDNVGYIFPGSPTKATVRDSLQQGTWYDINDPVVNASKEIISAQVFNLYIDHGPNPTNANYQYIVVPNNNLTDFQAKTSNNAGFKIIKNDSTAQAVLNSISGEYAIVFYVPGTVDMLDGMKITSDKPAFVLVKKNATTYGITVSDPLYVPSPADLHLQINGQSITFTFPSGNYDGRSISKTIDICPASALPIPTITANGSTTFCKGQSIVLTASTGSSFTWFNGTTTVGVNATLTVSTPGTYTLKVANANGCFAVSNPLSITVLPVPLATLSATGATTFCQGGSVNLNASTGTSYRWYNGNTNAGNTANKLTATISGIFKVEVTNSFGCTATSAGIAVQVIPLPTATITGAGPTTFCQGYSVALTTNSAAGYVWKRNGSPVGSARNFLATIAGSYTVDITDGNSCTASSNSIPVTVNPLPTATITSAGPTTFCQGNSVVLTANSANGYVWKRNGSPVGSVRTFLATIAGSYTVDITDANGCGSTSAVTVVSVSGLSTVSVSITHSAASVCTGTSVAFTATGFNTGISPTYTWFVNNSPKAIGQVFSFVPRNADLVTAVLSTTGNCLVDNPATSNEVQLTVNPLLYPSLLVNASANPTCSNTGVTYSVASYNSGTNPSFVWTVNGTVKLGNSPTFQYAPSNNELIRALLTVGGTLPYCLVGQVATSPGITALVNGTIYTSLQIAANSTTICGGNSVNFTTTASGTGTSPVYAWYVNGAKQLSTNANFSYVPATLDMVRATLVPGGNGIGCILGGTATSNGVSLTVLNPTIAGAYITASTTTVCAGSFISLTASGTNLGPLPAYTWYVNGLAKANGQSYTYAPALSDQVSVIASAGNNPSPCLIASTATSPSISLTLKDCSLPMVSSISGPSFVAIGSTLVTYSVTPVSGDSYHWTVPAGAVLSSGQGTNIISVDFGNALQGQIILVQTNANGSTSVSLNISSGVPPTSTFISGPTIVNEGQQGVTYSISTVAGVSYQWKVQNGAQIVNGQGTGTVTINFNGSFSGFIGVSQSNNYGTQKDSVSVKTSIPTEIAVANFGHGASLFPNPSAGTFQVNLGDGISDATVTITDDKGMVQLVTDKLTDLGGLLSSGHYIVTIQTQNSVKQLPLVKLE